jgi:hypothetical protein
MSTEGGLWADVLQAVAGSAVFSVAAWGAMGGATSGLLIKVSRRDLIRHTAIGALVAGGVGALALPLVMWAVNLPSETVAPVVGGLAGSSAYLAGLILPGVFEVLLTRLRRGVLPSDPNQGGPDV